MARKPLGMTEAEACQVLEVTLAEGQELDDEMLKAAYRSGPASCAFCCTNPAMRLVRPETFSVHEYQLQPVHASLVAVKIDDEYRILAKQRVL